MGLIDYLPEQTGEGPSECGPQPDCWVISGSSTTYLCNLDYFFNHSVPEFPPMYSGKY